MTKQVLKYLVPPDSMSTKFMAGANNEGGLSNPGSALNMRIEPEEKGHTPIYKGVADQHVRTVALPS